MDKQGYWVKFTSENIPWNKT